MPVIGKLFQMSNAKAGDCSPYQAYAEYIFVISLFSCTLLVINCRLICLTVVLLILFSLRSYTFSLFQDLLILACGHPENRSSLTRMDEWPEWILEILISNHEVTSSTLIRVDSSICLRPFY